MEDWKYADLRALDGVDSSGPGEDLIALYTRVMDKYFQLRLDLFDLDTLQGQDIYVLIDAHPGGSSQVKMTDGRIFQAAVAWDYLICIPQVGNIKVMKDNYSPISGSGLLVSRDPSQDNVVISFRLEAIPVQRGLSQIQVLTTAPNQAIVADVIDPVRIDAPSPSRARIAFAFWNTFPSATPAKTLRSWKGAHSGPMSTRHGLYYLLEAAARTRTPVILLDLLEPDNLAALDYLSVLPWVQDLIHQDILILPVVNNTPSLLYKDMQTNINKELDWINIFMMDSNNDFVSVYDYAKLLKLKECYSTALIPNNGQSSSGMIDQCKKMLVSQSISGSPTPTLLGGDFSNSLLGDPTTSLAFFTYIQNHPWIEVLSRDDLYAELDIPSTSNFPLPESGAAANITLPNELIAPDKNLTEIYQSIYSEIQMLPKNQISDLARQVFYSMAGSSSPAYETLRDQYAGQIGQIIEAAKWVDHPYQSSRCDIDLDHDGNNECVLSNQNIFLTIEPAGGYIPFIFSSDSHGAHQIIGPTWEFMLGISDSTLWDLSQGIRSDPDQILGAFDQKIGRMENFSFDLKDNGINLFNVDMTMRKSFEIIDHSVFISVRGTVFPGETTDIPLVIDPWIRFTPDWGDKYVFSEIAGGIKWGITAGVSVELQSIEQISFYPFNATHGYMNTSEDPNFDYPRGHYLPYPIALAEITPPGEYSIKITINP